MAELPQGTVTLVFTDVEGSTLLLASLGSCYHEGFGASPGAPSRGVQVAPRRRGRQSGDGLLRRLPHAPRCRCRLRPSTTSPRPPPLVRVIELRVRMGIHPGTRGQRAGLRRMRRLLWRPHLRRPRGAQVVRSRWTDSPPHAPRLEIKVPRTVLDFAGPTHRSTLPLAGDLFDERSPFLVYANAL